MSDEDDGMDQDDLAQEDAVSGLLNDAEKLLDSPERRRAHAPSLAGSVWHGMVDLEGGAPGLCAVTGTRACRLTDGYGWVTCGPHESAAVYRAWALTERARAEKAEKIAAAERALRKADAASLNAVHEAIMAGHPPGVGDFAEMAKREETARAALRALGVEP